MKNKEERFKMISAVYLILERNGEILLQRRFKTGYEDGNYGLPSGHVEGESAFTKELIREAKEEIGIVIHPKDVMHALTLHRWCGDHERVELFFSVNKCSGDIKNMEPNKCDDLSWFPINNMPPNTVDYIKEVINCYLNGQKYLEFGWR